MKILHVVPLLSSAGAEIFAGKLALYQKRLGHETMIATMYPPDQSFANYPDRELIEKEIPIRQTSSRVKLLAMKNRKGLLSSWQKILLEFKPDVIHSHIYAADMVAHSIVIPRTAYITHLHGPVTQLEPKNSFPRNKKEWYLRLERRWCHRRYSACRTHFIAISKDAFDYAKTIVPSFMTGNIHLLHNAIELQRFPFRKRSHTSPVKLVTTGNLKANKNHDFLIRVVDYLLNSGLDCELDILGRGEKELALRDLISQLGLQNKIHLRGTVSNVNEYLQPAEIYLHACQPEAFGLAILEAMATGLPVVALDGGGNRDLISDNVNGFLVEEKNVEEFAQKILLLEKDAGLYERISIAAAQAARGFDIDNYTSDMIGLYEDVLNSKRSLPG